MNIAISPADKALGQYRKIPGKLKNTQDNNLALTVNNWLPGARLSSIPMPEISSDEVLIQTIQVGICSTDREIFNGTLRQQNNGKQSFNFSFSFVPGHEALGRIVETGSNVKDLLVGELVVPTVRRGCNICWSCANGQSDFCSTGKFTERGIMAEDGFLCQYFKEKPENLINIPMELEKVAVLLEPLSIVKKALSEALTAQRNRIFKSTDVQPNKVFKKCLVAGCGTIGLMAVYLLHSLEIPFTCIDTVPFSSIKARQVRKLGGEYIQILPSNTQKPGYPVDLNMCGQKFDLILEAGITSTLSFALPEQLCANGILVLIGIPEKNQEITIPGDKLCNKIVNNNNMIIGVVNSNRSHFSEALEDLKNIVQKTESSFTELITHRFLLHQFEKALNVPDEERVKVIVEF